MKREPDEPRGSAVGCRLVASSDSLSVRAVKSRGERRHLQRGMKVNVVQSLLGLNPEGALCLSSLSNDECVGRSRQRFP